ncbi:MAG: 2OG-Fe(II) oxygenase family protein [Gammaproteobacteria bacterium]|nr:2OG-Fe(II) oxygenase family protein [Gammaproteobacteria bacterium]
MQGAPHPNVSNVRSVDTRVLDAPELQSIRSIVMEHINQYARKIISADEKLEFYLTQSWLNYTQTGQSHHRHVHTNSLISGVLYINVKKEIDGICFYRNSGAQISVSDEYVNWYNSPSTWFGVGVGDVVLFPSSLSHGVEQTTGEHTRISLAFNAFVRGQIGSEELLNSLKI